MTIFSNVSKVALASVGLAMFMGASLVAPSTADATLSINVNIDGVNQGTCVDGQACDGSGAAGVVAVVESTLNWTVTVSTGSGTPALTAPNMNLSVTAIANGAGTLIVTMVEDNYTAPTGDLNFTAILAAGAWDENFRYQAILTDVDGNQTIFDELIPGASAGGTFSGSALDADAVYSLTVIATLTAGADGTNGSIDTRLVQVPEPATLGMMGFGLLLLGFYLHRRRTSHADLV